MTEYQPMDLVMEKRSGQESKERFEVRLDRIRRIEPVDGGAEFGVIEFYGVDRSCSPS